MLFNSYPFIFLFLPIALGGYFALARLGKGPAAGWLAACSLFFYGYWDIRYVPLLCGSIVANFIAGTSIAMQPRTNRGRTIMVAAVAANLGLLGYFKYADFFIGTINGVMGSSVPLLHVVLPIGISFFTFTQIAFLADAYAGHVREYRFVYYLLFVSYFPHLIAGPVLHHREMMPQFDLDRNYRPRAANFAIGLTIFSIGLAKKVLIADQLAPFANPVFDVNAASAPTLFVAWGGVLAYTFQLYFDFSGYSDMAIGLARLFGVRLPLNFNSPYKAANISEFWRRWHMTLSRFLRDYLYIPLGGNRKGEARRNLNLMVTMLLGGLWHGAGWTFVIWGGLHGLFLVIHQAWTRRPQSLRWNVPYRFGRPVAVLSTFLCVVVAWVYFRAPDMETANRIALGLGGWHGAAIPEAIATRLGPLADLTTALGIVSFSGGGARFVANWAWVVLAFVLVAAFPNTQEIMRRARPAFDFARPPRGEGKGDLEWRPICRWAVATGVLLALGVLALSRPTEFLYFQF